MLVQCPSCKHLFDLPESSFSASKFRCSSCKAVWVNDHKLVDDQPKEPKTTADWILLWSVLGLLVVALYADFPRVTLFFSNFKTSLYRGNADPFQLNKISEDEEDRRPPGRIHQDEVTQTLSMTEETDDPHA